nr:RRXRR domain-containing protein [Limnoraphis robusta]
MPTKASRARRWVRDGKAKVVQNVFLQDPVKCTT